MPPGPANHPSAPSEGPFSSQQLVSFQLLLINFLKHFPLARELPADAPGGAPKVGVWGNSQGGVLRRGSIRKVRVLEKQKHTQCRPIEGMVKTPGDAQARGHGGKIMLPYLPTAESTRLRKGSEDAEYSPSSSHLKDVFANTHTLTPPFHKVDVGFLRLLPLANPGSSKEWSPKERD